MYLPTHHSVDEILKENKQCYYIKLKRGNCNGHGLYSPYNTLPVIQYKYFSYRLSLLVINRNVSSIDYLNNK